MQKCLETSVSNEHGQSKQPSVQKSSQKSTPKVVSTHGKPAKSYPKRHTSVQSSTKPVLPITSTSTSFSPEPLADRNDNVFCLIRSDPLKS